MPIMPGVMSALNVERNSVDEATPKELGTVSELLVRLDDSVSVLPIEFFKNKLRGQNRKVGTTKKSDEAVLL
jgi:hypothetical protein